MNPLSNEDFNRLALEAAEMLGFESGNTVAYDVAGYDRIERVYVDPSRLAQKDLERPEPLSCPPGAQFAERAYLVRMAGFRRRDTFGPDEIGALFRRHGIAWTDGLGNGLYESLLICHKYGLGHALEAPILGFQTPFTAKEWATFPERYAAILEGFVEDLSRMQAAYAAPLVGPGRKLVVLWARDYPLAHLMHTYRRDPDGVAQAFKENTGLERLPVTPQTPAERLDLVRFWNWVQAEQARLSEAEADMLREALGEGTLVIANPHELPVLDFEAQGRVFDYPAVAARPLLLDDDVMLRDYIAYFTRLNFDLTGKAPMVSVRMNLSASSPQYVPGGGLIRAWYDQAVRHGAGGFYFWSRDYPPNDDPDTYDGPIPGNPEPNTLPQERWETSLEVLGRLATHRRFQPPEAQVAILVPSNSALLYRREWRRIYAAFSMLAEARIHARFVSDRQVVRGELPRSVRVLLAPELEFVSDKLRERLADFTRRGGALCVHAGPLYDLDGQPAPGLDGAQPLEREFFEIFPLKRRASLEALQANAAVLAELIRPLIDDPQSWVFDVCLEHLPPAHENHLREPDPRVQFTPWQYEHGSEWIMPYLRPLE